MVPRARMIASSHGMYVIRPDNGILCVKSDKRWMLIDV
jgi:hypothetical protein